jgi:hypothetical protein
MTTSDPSGRPGMDGWPGAADGWPGAGHWPGADGMTLFAPPDPGPVGDGWEFDGELAQLLRNAADKSARCTDSDPETEGPDVYAAPRHRRQRRTASWPRPRLPGPVQLLRCVSLLIAACAGLIVAVLSVLGGVVSYPPLRHQAAPGTSPALAGWWPLLVYGPWLVGSLGVLRAALHQRRAVHSWIVVAFFSGFAMYLSIVDAPRTATAIAVAALPAISAPVAFHQLVRQITLFNPPRHALPRQRRPRPPD